MTKLKYSKGEWPMTPDVEDDFLPPDEVWEEDDHDEFAGDQWEDAEFLDGDFNDDAEWDDE